MRNEAHALGGLFDAYGPEEFAFHHGLALHIGNFYLTALSGELDVAAHAEDMSIAADQLGADVAARVADFDVAALAVRGHAAGQSVDLQAAVAGPHRDAGLLGHVDFQVHFGALALALRPHLVAAGVLGDR